MNSQKRLHVPQIQKGKGESMFAIVFKCYDLCSLFNAATAKLIRLSFVCTILHVWQVVYNTHCTSQMSDDLGVGAGDKDFIECFFFF